MIVSAASQIEIITFNLSHFDEALRHRKGGGGGWWGGIYNLFSVSALLSIHKLNLGVQDAAGMSCKLRDYFSFLLSTSVLFIQSNNKKKWPESV